MSDIEVSNMKGESRRILRVFNLRLSWPESRPLLYSNSDQDPITLSLKVTRKIPFVINQIDAKIFYVCLFLFSACFEQPCAHHQEK